LGLRRVQIALTLAIVAGAIYVLDWGEVLATLNRASPWLLGLAVALWITDRLLMTYKWSLLLAVQNVRVPLWQLWSLYSTATLASLALPATVGSDALRVLWLWRRGASGSATAISVLLERAIGFATGLCFAAAGLFYLARQLEHQRAFADLWIVVVVAVPLVALALILSFRIKPPPSLRRFLSGCCGDRLITLLAKLHRAHVTYRAHGGTIAAFLALTLVEQILTMFMYYAIAAALAVPVDVPSFLAAIAVSFLVGRLPITIDGIGVFEAMLALTLSAAGVAVTDAVAIAIAGRLINIVAYLPGAITLMVFTDTRFGSLRAERQA
jgi:hypothetical protein